MILGNVSVNVNGKTKQKHSNLKACVGSCSKQMQAQSRKWNRALVLNLDRLRTTQRGPRRRNISAYSEEGLTSTFYVCKCANSRKRTLIQSHQNIALWDEVLPQCDVKVWQFSLQTKCQATNQKSDTDSEADRVGSKVPTICRCTDFSFSFLRW